MFIGFYVIGGSIGTCRADFWDDNSLCKALCRSAFSVFDNIPYYTTGCSNNTVRRRADGQICANQVSCLRATFRISRHRISGSVKMRKGGSVWTQRTPAAMWMI